MTDIVEELKAEAHNSTYTAGDDRVTVSSPMLYQAANEIERLRATIAQLRSIAGAVSLDAVTFGQIKKDARG